MLKDLIKNHVAPLMKQQGFRKNNLTWNRSNNGFVQVVNFQLSRHSTNDRESFTINIGIFDPQVWKICWATEPPKFTKEENCLLRVRVGQLLGARDLWWECNSSSKESEVGKEIEDILTTSCLPFLDTMTDYNEIFMFYSSGLDKILPIEKIYLAIVRYLNGDLAESDELLNAVSHKSKSWADRVGLVRSNLKTGS